MPRGRIDARLDAIERKLAATSEAKAWRAQLEEFKASHVLFNAAIEVGTQDEFIRTYPGYTPEERQRLQDYLAVCAEEEAWEEEEAARGHL